MQLAGEDIPLIGRILAVADTFDAMTTNRPYRKGLPIAAAIQEISDMSGTQFDPLVVELFVRAYSEGLLSGVMDLEKDVSKPRIDISETVLEEDPIYQICDKLFKNIDKIKFSSPKRHEIISMLDNEESTLPAIAKELENDPAIAAKILQMANSAFYGLVSEIRTIEQGMIVLGLREIKSMIYFLNIMDIFKEAKETGINMKKFWQHSVQVGLISRHIAKVFKNTRITQDSFLAGLMHDIGKVVMIFFYPDRYKGIYDAVNNGGLNFSKAETDEFGISHEYVGAYFCHKWKIPEFLDVYIKNHHQEKDETEYKMISRTVRIANDLSYRLEPAFVENYPLLKITDLDYKLLNISEDNLKIVLTDIREIIRKEENLIGE